MAAHGQWFFLVALSTVSATVRAEETAAEMAPPTDDTGSPPPIPPLDWMYTLTPVFGYLDNTTTINAKIPTRTGDKVREISLTGEGWGTGLMAVGFYKWLTAMNVFYYFPDVNSSIMWGNISLLQATYPTDFFLKPFVGMGIAYIGTDSDLYNYRYSVDDQLEDGTPTVGHAYFGHFACDTSNVMLIPEIGVKIKIPIQDWNIRPFYQFEYEHLLARARTGDGVVEVYRQADGSHLYQIPLNFDKENLTEYYSHVVGAGFSIDYHHFLSMQGRVYYNISHDLLSAQVIGSLMFSRYFGIAAYFEYQDMIVVDNIYFMLGLSFLGLPTDFWNAVEARRAAAMR